MSLTTITINTIEYVAFASLAEVNNYLNVEPVRSEAWNALTDDDVTRGPFIISGTRRLNLLSWAGEKTGGAAQQNAWPRTGLTHADGTAVADDEVPQEIEDATALLAGSINIDTATADSGTSGDNVKSAAAGSVNVSFFKSSKIGKVLQDESAFTLISQWLASSGVSAQVGGLYTGDAAAESTFDNIDQWGRSGGFP